MPSVFMLNVVMLIVVMLCRGALSKASKIICSVCLSINPWTFKGELSKGSLIYIFIFSALPGLNTQRIGSSGVNLIKLFYLLLTF